ncbi:acyltransferase family protein [Sphingomonas sp. Leaf4]|uniref:acyltransferase family protein n=1 Tax=Sphingomonas sp. Leaf4 TaxID=2876553 RepID=UPI001E512705|nr:acyltransferase family protein [Sphingomonas sp. Leaf4]
MNLRARHYGLDWLRIAAFALLVPYHIAMAFSPWDWVVKTPYAFHWLIVPMMAVTPWRLGLLFAVSGYASAMLSLRSAGRGDFAIDRSKRLLVPLAFAMVAVVPVEMWVRVREAGYPRPFGWFWVHDAWHDGRFWGVAFPSWEHLWFVAYLWVYTMVLVVLLAGAGGRTDRLLDRAAGWLMQGHRLLWAPLALLVGLRLALLFTVAERMGLASDWAGHSQYWPLFAAGFLLGRRPVLWSALHRHWRPAVALALAGGMVTTAVELRYPGTAVPPHLVMAIDRAARSVMAWGMIVTLFHLADALANRDHRWRLPLSRAVFPAYLVHHPVIVATIWFLLPFDLGAGVMAAIVFAVTIAACAAACLAARAVPTLGLLLGMPPRGTAARGGMARAI